MPYAVNQMQSTITFRFQCLHSLSLSFLSCPLTKYTIFFNSYRHYPHRPFIRLDGLYPYRSFSAFTSAHTYVLLFEIVVAAGSWWWNGEMVRWWCFYCSLLFLLLLLMMPLVVLLHRTKAVACTRFSTFLALKYALVSLVWYYWYLTFGILYPMNCIHSASPPFRTESREPLLYLVKIVYMVCVCRYQRTDIFHS